MSEDKPQENQVTVTPYADFTMKDLEIIQKFKDKGLVGLAHIQDTDVERSMGLYLDGKSYRQIAQVTKVRKEVILFLSQKFKWFELRQAYLEELSATLPGKIMESKLQSQEFLLHLVLAYQKKIGSNIDNYLRTDNSEFHDRIDVKDINSLLKIMELLHKLSHENLGNPQDKALVGLNGLGEGMTITKVGSNSVEITPSKSPFSNKLKAFADLKREQEKANEVRKQSHDIVVEETLTKKEDKNE